MVVGEGAGGLQFHVKLLPEDLLEYVPYSPMSGVNTSFCISEQICYVLLSYYGKIYYVRVVNYEVENPVELMDGSSIAIHYLNGQIHYARVSSDEKTLYYGRFKIMNGSLVSEYEEVVDYITSEYVDGEISAINIAVSGKGNRLITYEYFAILQDLSQISELRVNGITIYNLRQGGIPVGRIAYPTFVGDTGYVVFYDHDGFVNVYKIEGSQATLVGKSEDIVEIDGLGAIGFNGSLYVTYVSYKDQYTRTVRLMVVNPDGSIIDKEIYDFQMDVIYSGLFWWATPFIYTKQPALYVLVYKAYVNYPESDLYLLRVDTVNHTAYFVERYSAPVEPEYRSRNYNFSTIPIISSKFQLFTYTVRKIENGNAYYNIMLGGFLLPVEEITEVRRTNLLPLLLILLFLLLMILRKGELKYFH
jgi:hypothetical protein